MEEKSIFIAGDSQALIYAAVELNRNGVPFTSDPDEAQILLYDIPTPAFMKEEIPFRPLIIGGNLDFLEEGYQKLDLLKDPWYLAHNALLTAQAAVGLLAPKVECSFPDAPVLILGWGRIGKCLDQLLRQMGFPVSVFARKPEDRAMLSALGYTAVNRDEMSQRLPDYKCIINTAPARILTDLEQNRIRKDCIQLDLATVRGLAGDNVHHARGLPGKYKAEASGKLIAETVLRHSKEVF